MEQNKCLSDYIRGYKVIRTLNIKAVCPKCNVDMVKAKTNIDAMIHGGAHCYVYECPGCGDIIESDVAFPFQRIEFDVGNPITFSSDEVETFGILKNEHDIKKEN